MADINEKVLTGAGLAEVWNIAGETFGGLRWHWWKYRAKQYQLAETKQSNFTRSWQGMAAPSWYCADAIEVLEDGSIMLVSPQSTRDAYSSGTYTSVLAGKYFSERSDGTTSVYRAGASCTLRITANASFTSLLTGVWSDVYLVALQATGADPNWYYCHSADRNAYPDRGEVDDFDYLYLGVPLYNSIDGMKIQTGEYVGTGTYGTADGGHSSLTFDFEPLLVIIGDTTLKANENNTSADITMFLRGVTGSLPTINSDSWAVASWSGNTLSWYGRSANSSGSIDRNQLNVSGHIYRWVAMKSL